MDDTDKKLLQLISEDPRIPLKELAKRLGTSRQTVNRRLQVLTRLGTFKCIRAKISYGYYGDLTFPVVWGISKAASIDNTLDRLGENESTFAAAVLGGGVLLVFGCLREVSELERYVGSVKRVADMPEATVGLLSYHDGVNFDCWSEGATLSRSCKQLSSLDLKIIAALHDDPRKPVKIIADVVGVSTKTVRRHIERMRSEGSLDFRIPVDFPPGESFFTLLFINLRSGADKVKIGRRILSRYPQCVLIARPFINIPDFVRVLLRSEKMSEIRRIIKEVSEDDDVVSVKPNLIYFWREYETTWHNKMLRTLARTPGGAVADLTESGLGSDDHG
ncbi:MAG: Lrp/AsnC family transcriptional regulator [Methanobacteriota archaeon]|nr:MAG: Lrp/AsnC family transcriptional regulator [Euryarchaeota archaeon]